MAIPYKAKTDENGHHASAQSLGMPSAQDMAVARAKALVGKGLDTSHMEDKPIQLNEATLNDPQQFQKLLSNPGMLAAEINKPGSAQLLAQLAQKPEFATQLQSMRGTLFANAAFDNIGMSPEAQAYKAVDTAVGAPQSMLALGNQGASHGSPTLGQPAGVRAKAPSLSPF